MSTVKLFEVRDAGTFMPIMAIRLEPQSESERWLFSRAGFGRHAEDQMQYVLVCPIDGGSNLKITCDPYDWGGSGTMYSAHTYIREHFDEIDSGAVIDVEFILGKTARPKISERMEEYER